MQKKGSQCLIGAFASRKTAKTDQITQFWMLILTLAVYLSPLPHLNGIELTPGVGVCFDILQM